MVFYNQRRNLMRYARYLRVVLKTAFIPKKDKTIFFDTSEIAINRYLYSFLKMFQLEGYSVFIPSDINTVNIITNSKGEFKYASWLLSEKILKFGKPAHCDMQFSKERLSNDYFNNKLEGYRVPICCYPWFYKNFDRLSNLKLKEKRKNSIFMSGNIDPQYYDSISDTKIFRNIPSRKKTADYLRNMAYYYPVKSKAGLSAYLEGPADHKLIIIDSSRDFRIELEELPLVLNRFNFYLALPGILVPQSHNLAEAMLFGCIPVIHKEYAGLLNPPLESFVNAIVFNSLEELETLIPEIFKLKDKKIEKMRKNVVTYYNDYLSPQAVVQNILDNPTKIFIQAEQLSLQILEKQEC